MSFLSLGGYTDRFNGENKTVFRDPELVYTVNPQDTMGIINDEEWYDRAVLQTEVWEHNIQEILEEDIPLTFNDYRKEMMFYEVEDDRIEGKLTAPAIVVPEYEQVEPYNSRMSFSDIPKEEEEQIREMQNKLDELIEDGRIAIQERECPENDYRGPGCLRQWGRTEDGEVYLLEFGEYHHRLEGPFTGKQFLEEHGIEQREHGIRSPIMVGDISGYFWQASD